MLLTPNLNVNNPTRESEEFIKITKDLFQSYWSPYSISMVMDLRHWNNELSEDDKTFISKILRGFTLIESRVGNYWTNIATLFPRVEISSLAYFFAGQESVHLYAYNYLEESLGLDTFDDFLKDEKAQEKLNFFEYKEKPEEAILNLAVFSGGAEGVSLYSSFAALLSFCRTGLMKGLSQIISYSVKDELLHSEVGCKLYRTLLEQYPEFDTEENKEKIYKHFDVIILNELTLLDEYFKNLDVKVVNKSDLQSFVLHRANDRLKALGLKPQYLEDETPVKDWFYTLVEGHSHNDFFSESRNGNSYSTQFKLTDNISFKKWQ